jgi:uncharacterized protein YceK
MDRARQVTSCNLQTDHQNFRSFVLYLISKYHSIYYSSDTNWNYDAGAISMMTRNRRLVSAMLIFTLSTTACASLTTASHFTKESPKIYSGTRLDIHAGANHDDILRVYRDKYGVEPPAYPELDLPFSLLFDTIILVPVVMPIVLYQAVFD